MTLRKFYLATQILQAKSFPIEYILKLILKFTLIVGIHILNFCFFPLYRLLYLNSYPAQEIFIFRSGAMGDLLLLYDSVNYLFSNYSLPPITVVTKASSITESLGSVYSSSGIRLISYSQFISSYSSNSTCPALLIDTEPYFPFGKLASFFFISSLPLTSISVYSLSNFTNLLSAKHSYVAPYSVNSQEGIVFLSLLLLSLEYFSIVQPANLLADLSLYTSHVSSPQLPNPNHLNRCTDFLNYLSTTSKPSILLYYGCSHRSRHRLPSYQFLLSFLHELSSQYNIHLLGGPPESFLINSKVHQYATTKFINTLSLSEWSSILPQLRNDVPIITFDGGFAHFLGLYTSSMFQIFCSSNPLKWQHKSASSSFFYLHTPCSPCNQPYYLQVPNTCILGDNACSKLNANQLVLQIQSWCTLS